ncbi:MAG: hypothetical protein ACI3ZT_04285 [Candidatus Cryptobacteroides sp.]
MSGKFFSGRKGVFGSFTLALVVAAGAAAMAMIPPCHIGNLALGRADVFGLYDNPEVSASTEFKADITRLDRQLQEFEQSKSEVADSLIENLKAASLWAVAPVDTSVRQSVKMDSTMDLSSDRTLVPIENYDTARTTALSAFGDALISGRPVKVAFMGDSFIEGDILTSDLRRMMQSRFGGAGVGFIPCDIPFKIYNKSVTRLSSGWTSYSIMKQKAVPESLKDKFLISGYLASGGPGASTVWEDKTGGCAADLSEIYLYAENEGRVEVRLNGSDTSSFSIPADGHLHSIRIEAPASRIELKVKSGRILCYGIRTGLASGFHLDNYSVRSNNGQAIFGTGAVMNRQYDEMVGYDMVVLQYGLNILQDGKTAYLKYEQQLVDIITYIRRSFPGAAVLVLGVSDRWIKDQGSEEFRPIDSASTLIRYQRSAARKCGVCFWNTLDAMEKLGGMPNFIENGWVAADHTHINYRGGKAFASKLYEAFCQCAYDAWTRRKEAELERIRSAELDSLMKAEMFIVPPESALKVEL